LGSVQNRKESHGKENHEAGRKRRRVRDRSKRSVHGSHLRSEGSSRQVRQEQGRSGSDEDRRRSEGSFLRRHRQELIRKRVCSRGEIPGNFLF